MSTETVTGATALMTGFAERTGLSPAGGAPIRYLWTDAFAVCNFLELFLATGETTFKNLALRLIDQVHHTLGRHREDDSRRGWISGLTEQEGKKHPTTGGLRIGKKFGERGIDEPFDQVLEWERDGQYYHYLTKWMHALNQAARVAEDARLHNWAVELARAAHAGFVYSPEAGGPKRMYWKMSIDLSRPQVASMGQHDPLDGLVTFLELRVSNAAGEIKQSGLLEREIADLTGICRDIYWATEDPLGLGGLLCDAFILAQLLLLSRPTVPPNLLPDILHSALEGLSAYSTYEVLSTGPEFRLAFRELGLAIGLAATGHLRTLLSDYHSAFDNGPRLLALTERLLSFTSLRDEINRYWSNPANRQTGSWLEHREINTVMLATSLAPDCFFSLTAKNQPVWR